MIVTVGWVGWFSLTGGTGKIEGGGGEHWGKGVGRRFHSQMMLVYVWSGERPGSREVAWETKGGPSSSKQWEPLIHMRAHRMPSLSDTTYNIQYLLTSSKMSHQGCIISVPLSWKKKRKENRAMFCLMKDILGYNAPCLATFPSTALQIIRLDWLN